MDRADIIQMMKKSVFPVRDHRGWVVGTCFAAAGGNFFSCCHVFYDDCNREYPDLTVELDGQNRKPDFQYPDLESDTAILRFAGYTPKDSIELGNFDRVREGDDVLFIGFPLGATHHVTHHGMVSAKGLIQNCVGLQIDASVNRGNSGGPCIAVQDGRPVCVGIIASRIVELDLKFFKDWANRAKAGADKIDPDTTMSHKIAGLIDSKLTETAEAIRPGFEQLDRLINVGFGEAVSIEHAKKAVELSIQEG